MNASGMQVASCVVVCTPFLTSHMCSIYGDRSMVLDFISEEDPGNVHSTFFDVVFIGFWVIFSRLIYSQETDVAGALEIIC